MNRENILEMKGISKAFPGVKALKQVDFSVRKGEVMALMGENGAGKSTLIKILTGVYKKDEGEVWIDGEKINPANTLEAQKAGVSTIFQELNLSPYLSIAENIYLGKSPKNKYGLIDWKTMNENAHREMLKLGIDIDVREPLHKQSTAVQQMVSIARASTEKMKLLIMDEATSSLTAHEIEVLFSLVRKLKEEGISIVFISHKLDEIYQISDKVTILKDGAFVACKPVSELSKLQLVSLMIGKDASNIIHKKKKYNPEIANHEVLCSVRGIEKANRRLTGMDLDIRKGEVVGIAGLLGAGKTELAKIIFGEDTNYTGEIFFNHQAVHFHAPYEAIKSGQAFCSEDRKVEGIFPFMSVQDNLVMTVMGKVSKFGIVNHKKLREITVDYINKVRIKTPSTSTPIKNLSGGNQQKVILSRWLTMKPDLIILDEPTRGIDVGAKSEIEDIVQDIASKGISVLYISSELEELVRQCDRIVVMSEGKKVYEFVGEEISVETLTAAMARDHFDMQNTESGVGEVCKSRNI